MEVLLDYKTMIQKYMKNISRIFRKQSFVLRISIKGRVGTIYFIRPIHDR